MKLADGKIGGIGLKPELDAVKSSSDGSSMISSDQWINLPVGNNLYDHVGVRELPF